MSNMQVSRFHDHAILWAETLPVEFMDRKNDGRLGADEEKLDLFLPAIFPLTVRFFGVKLVDEAIKNQG